MPDPLWPIIASAMALIPVDFGGGCPVPKANVMAWLIRRFNMAATVEIGVYRGRSLFPQAITHKIRTKGVAFGVDPYSPEIAMEYDNLELGDKIAQFTRETDWDGLFRGVIELRGLLELQDYCTLVRQPAAEAATLFARQGRRFGLAHIDGNHDTAEVTRDVETYLPLMEPGGFIIMDDISWDSVKPAIAALAERATLLIEVPRSRFGDYALFRVAPDEGQDELRAVLRRVAYDEPGALD